jgi:hypothetical protein
MSVTPTPRIIAAYAGMADVNRRIAILNRNEGRRIMMRRNGCRNTILTRAELARTVSK